MFSHSSALERLLQPTVGNLPAEYARQLLKVDFTPADQIRYRELSERSQLGSLSGAELLELEDLLTANDVLTILQAKAQSSLESPSAA